MTSALVPVSLEIYPDVLDLIIEGLGKLPAERSAVAYAQFQTIRHQQIEKAAAALQPPKPGPEAKTPKDAK